MTPSIRSSIRWRFREFRRRAADEPSYCRNCRSFSFTEWHVDGMPRARRWDCDECGWTHAYTFGGKWRADPPGDEDDV